MISCDKATDIFCLVDQFCMKFDKTTKNFILGKQFKPPPIMSNSEVTVYQYFKSENLSREVVKNIVNAFQTTENEIWGDVIPYPKKEPKFIDTPPSKPRREAVVVGLHDPEVWKLPEIGYTNCPTEQK